MKQTHKQVRKTLIAAWGGRMPTAKQMRHPSTQKQRKAISRRGER